MAQRLLLVLNAVLIIAAALLGVRLYQAATAPMVASPVEKPGASAGAGGATGPAESTLAPAIEPARPPSTVVGTIAEKNLFSPTRTETPPEPPKPAIPPGGVAAGPKPRLYGVVVLPDGRSRAFLEDAQRRRVVGFSVGDSVGDARLTDIKPDRVVLRRGAETFEVLLHDPTKPRTAAPAPVQSTEGGPPGRPPLGRPGPPSVVGPPAAPGTPGPPGAPGAQVPGAPGRGIVRPRPMVPQPEPRPDTPEPNADEE